MTLQSPAYADGGAFAINLWAKSANTSEQGPQYIFSHEAANSTSGVYNAWTTNMVRTAPAVSIANAERGSQLSYVSHRPVLICLTPRRIEQKHLLAIKRNS